MQERPAWIGLWRQLLSATQVFANYSFFQTLSAFHKTKNWVGLDKKKYHMWMWRFHDYYVLKLKDLAYEKIKFMLWISFEKTTLLECALKHKSFKTAN